MLVGIHLVNCTIALSITRDARTDTSLVPIPEVAFGGKYGYWP